MKKNQIFGKEKNRAASNAHRDYSRDVISQLFLNDQGTVPLLQEDLNPQSINEFRRGDHNGEFNNRETTSVSIDSACSLSDHHDFPSNYSPYYEYSGLAQEQRMRSFRVFEGRNIMRDIQEKRRPLIDNYQEEIFSKSDSSLNRLSDSQKKRDRQELEVIPIRQKEKRKSGCLRCKKKDAFLEFKGNKIRTSKYTILTFLPKNLLEQFSQLANIYFLFIAVLQMIKPISISNGKPMELLPLAFIVAVTMLKDIYEDRKRHAFDNEENLRKVDRFDPELTGFRTCSWQDLRVGDVVLVKEGEGIPADMMLVKTSNKQRICYLETRNLDGETNLKEKKADKLLSNKVSVKNPQTIVDLAGKVTCDESNEKLFKFEGAYYFEKARKRIALNVDSLLLRGCILRNTKHVLGIVVYTGHETKIFRNQQNSRFKMSSIQRGTNKQIIIVFIIQLLLCLFASGYNTIWFSVDDTNIFSFFEKGDEFVINYASQFFISLGTWMLIFTNFIPISLLVTLEFVKFFQAAFMQWEVEMFDEEQGIQSSVQASNLNEELGQVEYIFSDKTGTMTCNVMQFRKFSAGPMSYGQLKKVEKERDKHFNFKDQRFEDSWQTQGENYQYIKEVLIHMAVCHTVVWDSQQRRYNGSSPDEVALVNAAQRLQVEFLHRDSETNIITILFKGSKMTFKLLQVLEFSSARQRMSIIVRDSEGQIILFTKGADSIIMPRVDDKIRNYKDVTTQYANEYAREGFRTLVLCKKILDQEEYDQWFQRVYQSAQSRDVEREQALEQAYDEIEQRLCVIGCTAIEDKLQEKVDETIKFMRAAGIKVWVLTGDKVETAINIGQSSGLLDLKKMKIFQMTEGNFEDNFRCLEKLEGQIKAYESMESRKKGEAQQDEEDYRAQLRNSQINYTHQQTNRESETSSGSTARDGAEEDEYEFEDKGREEDIEFEIERKRSKQVNQTNSSSKYLFKGYTKNPDDNWDVATRQSKLGKPSEVKKLALVINGEALAFINSREVGRQKLLEVVDKISVVLACRVTPKQKSEIVQMIRKRFPNKVTLSIGDGANDVNMITTAHVGVGIAGLEGQQAARCADFVIGQFRFLKPLLFVHGREAYRRNSYLVCYNFYKNAVFVLVIFWYGALSAFSGQTIYESFIYQLFNIVFTSVPIMYYSVFIFQHEREYYLEHPETYILGLQHRCFGTKIFWQWILYGAFQAALILAITYFHVWPSTHNSKNIFPLQNEMLDFGMYDVWAYGVLVYFLVVIVVNLRIVFSYHIYTVYGELTIFLSILLFYLTVLVYSQITIFNNDIYQLLMIYTDLNVLFKVIFAIFAFPILDQIAGLTVGLIRDNNRPEYMGIEEFSNLSDPYLTRRQFRRSTIFSFKGQNLRNNADSKEEKTVKRNTKAQFSGSHEAARPDSNEEVDFQTIKKDRADSRDMQGYNSWRQGREFGKQDRGGAQQRQAQSDDYGIAIDTKIRGGQRNHDMEVENGIRDTFQQRIEEQIEFNQQQKQANLLAQEEERKKLKKRDTRFQKQGTLNERYQRTQDEDEFASIIAEGRQQHTVRANTILNSSEVSSTQNMQRENERREDIRAQDRNQHHNTVSSKIKVELTLTQSNLAPSSKVDQSSNENAQSEVGRRLMTSPKAQDRRHHQQAILMDLEDDDEVQQPSQQTNIRTSRDSSRE